jgi:hypothetical protein
MNDYELTTCHHTYFESVRPFLSYQSKEGIRTTFETSIGTIICWLLQIREVIVPSFGLADMILRWHSDQHSDARPHQELVGSETS